MKELQKEYECLLNMQDFHEEELDYGILDKHLASLSQFASISNSGITVYDSFRRKHAFVSYNFADLFNYDMSRIKTEDVDYFTLQIHPEDVRQLIRNGTTALRFIMEAGENAKNFKMISEYRINAAGKYIRVIEQMQVLEFDPHGNPWLSLSILDISPNQTLLTKVESKLLNFTTGEVFMLPEFPENKDRSVSLTTREKMILQLVRDGFLSKEISEQLKISVNTVNTHRQRIIEKLDVNNSHEAIKYATKVGLI